MVSKFLKMAVANLLRYGTRTALTGIGLALAIAAVLFVNVVALSFESGTADVYRFIRQTGAGPADIWLTPATGFELNRQTGFFAAQGTLPETLVDPILVENQSGGLKVLTSDLSDADIPLTLYGCSDCQQVSLSRKAATALNAQPGASLKLKQTSLKVDRINEVPDLGAGGLVQVPLALAQQILDQPGQVSWVMLRASNSPALRQVLTEKNALVTTDPTAIDRSKPLAAYFLEARLGRGDMVSFEVKLAAIYFNQATSSLLGWLSRITLGLGFVLMLSAALLSIEERRREFGIFAAVGVSSDIFYLFFLESLLLFVGATLLGLLLGMGLLMLLTPALFSWGVVLKSSALVICYLPPMIIFGAMVPAQRLLQKTPLQLLRSAA